MPTFRLRHHVRSRRYIYCKSITIAVTNTMIDGFKKKEHRGECM